MKDYGRFSVKDFIMDEYFQLWVFNPVGNIDAYWQRWLDENPDKRSDVEEARMTLLRLNFSSFELPSEDVSYVWNKIRSHNREAVTRPKGFFGNESKPIGKSPLLDQTTLQQNFG